jgi:HEAT repeat protein
MLSLILSAFLLATPQEGAPQPVAPTPEQIAEVRDALDQAYRSDDPERIQAALDAAREVPDRVVVRKVLKALGDKRSEVRLAAITSLRWLTHPDALTALHKLARERKTIKDPATMAAVLRAIGQHASPSSVAILARSPFEPDDHACRRTRVLALGRIRTRTSLEALLGILAQTNPRGDARIKPHMREVRLSLMILTGLDRGSSPALWEEWWRDNRKTFEISPEPPLLPRDLRLLWDGFWGLPQDYARVRRREDRGGD